MLCESGLHVRPDLQSVAGASWLARSETKARSPKRQQREEREGEGFQVRDDRGTLGLASREKDFAESSIPAAVP